MRDPNSPPKSAPQLWRTFRRLAVPMKFLHLTPSHINLVLRERDDDSGLGNEQGISATVRREVDGLFLNPPCMCIYWFNKRYAETNQP